jgi:TetR/AcrR family transcriptional regulator, transcriptional repressor for nem operon
MATRARSAHVKASQPKSAKKDLLLKTAQRLMLQRGYWATSVDEICAAAKLSKGAFFHYFTSKKDLGAQTLQYFFTEILDRLKSSFGELPEDPLERVGLVIQGMAQILSAPEGPRGCLIATFTIDTAEADADLRERCAVYFTEWGHLLESQLQTAINHYAPAGELDSTQLSCYCISVIEGSLLLVRAGRDAAVLSGNLELLMEQLRSLICTRPPRVRAPARPKRKSAA